MINKNQTSNGNKAEDPRVQKKDEAWEIIDSTEEECRRI